MSQPTSTQSHHTTQQLIHLEHITLQDALVGVIESILELLPLPAWPGLLAASLRALARAPDTPPGFLADLAHRLTHDDAP